MAAEQLELFPLSQDEINANKIDELEQKLDSYFKRSENVRRGTYANINELKKIVLDLVQRLEIYERAICKGNN